MECNHRASALMKRTVFFLFFSHFYKSKLLNFQKKDKMLSVGDPRARVLSRKRRTWSIPVASLVRQFLEWIGTLAFWASWWHPTK